MNFNYELLKQTKKEIEGMKFFKQNIQINTEEYELIHDFEQAYDNAFNKVFKYEQYTGQTWVDILEENMSKVWSVIYQYDNYKHLSDEVDGIDISEIKRIEYTVDDYDVQEEISNEIELCVKSRFVCGKENVFFESLFKAYKLGGWPCGWNNGKIIVYMPENDQQNA